MKKKILIVSLLFAFIMGVTGCTKQGVCEDCGKEGTLYHYKSTLVIMEKETKIEGWFCEDCCEDEAAVCDSLNEYLPGSATYSY